ncbi:copper resistance CopC family protein [Micropruina sp.]|uniref:copper resistance CopC family protein n=1 Tax=Micropruina sp. TaxID=2737536 RepID=UPI0039E5AACF
MRYRRLLAALLIGTLSVLALGGTRARAADDYLVGSDPQPRQELSEVPGWVTLAFRTKASAKLAKILVFDAGGRNVTTGALIVEGTNVTSQLDFDLPKGTYSVYYRTSDASGKPRGGAFQFAYGKGNWTPLDKEVWVGEEEQPPVLANPDPNATEPAKPGESTPASPSTSASPSEPAATPQPSDSPTATAPAEQPAASDNSAAGWLVAGGIVVAGLIGWGAVLMVRRNRAGD